MTDTDPYADSPYADHDQEDTHGRPIAPRRRPHDSMRLRLAFAGDRRPVLVLTDTPRPGCRHCCGEGWFAEYVQDGPDPEDGDRLDVMCDCWSSWRRRLFPVPAWLARRYGWQPIGYSDEPPF